jgi:kynurenine formamidase
MKIDLTLHLNENHAAFKRIAESDNKHLQLGHFATHLDTHLNTTPPLDYMVRRGILFDVTTITTGDITTDVIDTDLINAGDFVIFKTDMIKRFEYGSVDYFSSQPELSNSLIDMLIEKKISFIGIDAGGLKKGETHVEADKRCESAGIYIIENMDNLDQLSLNTQGHDFKLTTLWIEFPGQTGLPCRVIAEVFSL